MTESSVTVAPSSSVTATPAAQVTAALHLEVLVTQAGAAQTAPTHLRGHSAGQSRTYVTFQSTALGRPSPALKMFIYKMEPPVVKTATAIMEIVLTALCTARRSLVKAQ